MQPISKETIEHADDFIFHLSDNQVKEFLDDLKKKQPVIWEISNNTSIGGNSKEGIIFIKKLHLTIFHCFKQYPINIPIISLEELNAYSDIFMKIYFSPDTVIDDIRYFIAAGQTFNQGNLSEYIVYKISEYQHLLQSSDGLENGGFVMVGTMFIYIFSEKTKRLLPPSND